MRKRTKVPIVLVALLFVLAAAAEVATSRGKPQSDHATRPTQRAALETVDQALARHDAAAALRAWQRAYEVARSQRGWRALVEAGDAAVRIDAAAPGTAAPRARRAYLAAFDRARAERSMEGVVRVAEGFSQLGDREVTERVLRVAASLAQRSGDAAAPTSVEMARARLLERASGLTQTTF